MSEPLNLNIDLEAQTVTATEGGAAPWEALDLRPYMADSYINEIGVEQPEITEGQQREHVQPAYAEKGTPASPSAGPDLFSEDAKTRPKIEALPPRDPSHWPLHSKLFVAGFLFFPCWWYGAWRPGEDVYAEMHRFRCSALTISSVAIIVTLLILEAGFRNV
ncbi:hypothetical protein EUX98_g3488 [Antrodiella citrinella]|uniref:Uncharacterized protein n=1 Tax=Antrodiella citrinella TaxID=2447956 RepID=A0A4S4MZ61_9APHY|nr:hypothetical protein EUX98_g3488 [Antrodiella citrinella]